MMKIYLFLIFLINSLGKFASSTQPYFPPQIVFSPNNGQTIFGIDEIKERQKAKAFVYFLCSAAILYVGVSSILS